jgi:hypothetical protein
MVPAIGFYWIFWPPNIGVHDKDFNHYVQNDDIMVLLWHFLPLFSSLITRQNRGVLSGLPNLTWAAAKNCASSASELWQAPLWPCLFIVRNNKSEVFFHVTDEENIFQVSSYPGNFFPSFFRFFPMAW